MKLTLEYVKTIPTSEEAGPEERQRIDFGMEKVAELAFADMLNSFVISGDSKTPIPRTTLAVKESEIASPDSAGTEFMKSVLMQFYRCRCWTFKIAHQSDSILTLRRIEPYMVHNGDPSPSPNPAFLDGENIVLLVSAPTESYKTSVKRLENNRAEFALQILDARKIRSVWCRRSDVTEYYSRISTCA